MAVNPISFPGYYAPQSMDLYSPLSDLGKTYRDAQLNNERKQMLSNLGKLPNGQPDFGSASLKLMQIGDTQGAATLAQLGNTLFDREYKTGMLDVARQQANRKDAPTVTEIYDEASGQPRKVAVTSAGVTPIGGVKVKEKELTGADRKAIFEAEDSIAGHESTLETLKRAKELIPSAFTGATAGARAEFMTKAPNFVQDRFDPATRKGAEATAELNRLMSLEAVKSMSTNLKGATTDRELFEFQRILADPSTTPEIRARTVDRMIALAERQKQIAADRMNQLRGGTYYRPGGGQSNQASPAGAAGAGPPPAPAAAAQQYSKGMRARNPQTGEAIEFDGYKWVPVK